MNIRVAFAKHVDKFLFNGVKTITTPSETYELSLEQGIVATLIYAGNKILYYL